ncbi:WD40/YVTN repeat-like containing protein [Gracilaria domingensis]|nr:WD40/YVTN repeat-like containing protein [Gracilaria domingensis]
MDIQLRCIASHPYGFKNTPQYALSSSQPRLLTATKDLIADHNIVTNAVRVTLRTTSPVDKLVHVGGSKSFLAFLHDGHIVSYVDSPHAVYLADERSFDAGRSVTLACGSPRGQHAVFVKSDSPSIWCVRVESDGEVTKPFKLRSHIDGNQSNVGVVDGMLSRVRGRVATSAKSRLCPISAVAIHDDIPRVAAVYENGIVRVWDISKKELQSCFDAQLLMSEKPIDIALHPFHSVVTVCTSLGRLLAFNVQSGTYRRGEQPGFACSRVRETKRRFRAMCFTKTRPGYLLLLTTSQRIVVKMINSANMIVSSSRFPKPSRLPSVMDESFLVPQKGGTRDHNRTNNKTYASLATEPTFGLFSCTLDTTGNVYVFQSSVAGLPAIQRPITSGLDSGFSFKSGDIFKGPVLVDSDSLVIHQGSLFRYELGVEQISFCCQLPPGDIQRIEVARDADGFCVGALVFYDGDSEADNNSYADPEPPEKYVLCTRRENEQWNVSEPVGGKTGCFLGAAGEQDKIFIVSSSGSSASLFSFAAPSNKHGLQETRQSRGVQRFKLVSGGVRRVFRTPFARWNAVLYHDIDHNRLVVSRNAFESDSYVRDNYHDAAMAFAVDDDSAVALRENEIVIDVRWQKLPSRSDQYIGAIMTDRRIFFVRHILSVHSVFDMQSIQRKVVPFCVPNMSWVGPSILLAQGNSVFSVALNSQADLVVNLSNGGHLPALVACLPDRIVHTITSPDPSQCSLAIATRPYSALSSTVRGMLSFENLKSRRSPDIADKVKAVLDTHDASQASAEVTDSLIESNLTPIAYLISVSAEGRGSLSPLRRAALLGRLGDFNGSLNILEEEYARLPSSAEFHDGTELFRMIQRTLNMSFAAGDFAVGRRCSTLLGRKGTFSAFVDTEGGYAALRSVITAARISRNTYLLEVLRPLLEKSSVSSVATDSSMIVKQRDRQNLQRAIKAVNASAISLGSVDQRVIMVRVPPEEDAEGRPLPAQQTKLVTNTTKHVSDRLLVMRREVFHEYESFGGQTGLSYAADEFDGNVTPVRVTEQPSRDQAKGGLDDSSDDDLFGTTKQERAEGADEGGAMHEEMASSDQRDLTDITRRNTEETRRMIATQKEKNEVARGELKAAAGQMVVSQRNLHASGAPAGSIRAPEIFERAVAKYSNKRFVLAQKELDSALRSIARGRERGVIVSSELLNGIVFYQMACRIRIAMEEIASGEHANTIPGRVTYAQLANGLTKLQLSVADRIDGLVQAADANILLGNFGTAAQAMRLVKQLGIPDGSRASLREKYAVCQTRGFVDTMPQSFGSVCFRSLKVISTSPCLRCMVCPAVFATDIGIVASNPCPCCGVGQVVLS